MLLGNLVDRGGIVVDAKGVLTVGAIIMAVSVVWAVL